MKNIKAGRCKKCGKFIANYKSQNFIGQYSTCQACLQKSGLENALHTIMTDKGYITIQER